MVCAMVVVKKKKKKKKNLLKRLLRLGRIRASLENADNRYVYPKLIELLPFYMSTIISGETLVVLFSRP